MIALLLVMQIVATKPVPIEGKYLCRGQTPQGPYDMALQITTEENNFFLVWTSNKVEAKGLGVRIDNAFSAVFMTHQGNVGIITYRITRGMLEGYWAAGDGKLYKEVCSVGHLSQGD